MSTSDSGNSNTKEWVLEPEAEYRFELDPGTSLAIKVRPRSDVDYANMRLRSIMLPRF